MVGEWVDGRHGHGVTAMPLVLSAQRRCGVATDCPKSGEFFLFFYNFLHLNFAGTYRHAPRC
jgi:hypothetical protein